MHLFDDTLQTHFNCDDELHDGPFWSLIFALTKGSKCQKVIVRTVGMFQLFTQIFGEKGICKVRVLINPEWFAMDLLIDISWICDSVFNLKECPSL